MPASLTTFTQRAFSWRMKRLVDEGAEIRLMSPADFGGFMRQENARWVKVVKDAGIQPQ